MWNVWLFRKQGEIIRKLFYFSLTLQFECIHLGCVGFIYEHYFSEKNQKYCVFSLDHLKDITARAILLSPQWVYERNFVAFYNGERAGVCVLKYHGDKEYVHNFDTV